MDWDALVSRFLHPTKLWIVEAMLWIDEPLSASELEQVLTDEVSLSALSYHLRALVELEVIEEVYARPARGAIERFYGFTAAVLAPA